MNSWQPVFKNLRRLIRPHEPHVRQVRQLFSPVLGREVDMDFYLPPDYFVHPDKRFPLVIFNDGQDLPIAHLGKVLESLYRRRQLPYVIAVGIHAGRERMREYGTAGQPDYKGRGDLAGRYRVFIIRELLPYLYGRLRLSGLRTETAVAGFSLGGLSAFDIAWAFPEIFGAVGVFSGALWWRYAPVDPLDPDGCRIVHEWVGATSNVHPDQRFWFQCGTLDEEEDRNGNGIIDVIDDTMDLIAELKNKGYGNDQIRYLEVQDGRHDPQTWGKAMPDFLKWVFTVET